MNESARKRCQVVFPTASWKIPYRKNSPASLDTEPGSKTWAGAASTSIIKDCTWDEEYPDLKTEIHGFWTASHLYLLFVCPYRTLNLFLPADNGNPRDKLWDRDVVEMFLGDDWQNIRHYREFEVAPTGDWIDLAINLDQPTNDLRWRSGWTTKARIDDKVRTWFAAAQIPLKSVSNSPVKAGTRWRMNLYRIDGEGPDTQRRFMCWQPTCVIDRDPNHVPEAFGTLIFGE